MSRPYHELAWMIVHFMDSYTLLDSSWFVDMEEDDQEDFIEDLAEYLSGKVNL
jgi:hypothetical protein